MVKVPKIDPFMGLPKPMAGQKRFYLIEVSAGSESDQLFMAYLSTPSGRDGVRHWHHCLASFLYEALGIFAYVGMCSEHLRTWLNLQRQFSSEKQEGDRTGGDRPQPNT